MSNEEERSMKITVLSENTTRGPKVTPEFGLSLHIACGSQSILFDSGSSDNFARNARVLGIDLARVDMAVLSHGHFDHSNGFGAFMALNDHAPIYAHEGFDGEYFKKPDEYIGIAPELKGNDRFEAVDGIRELGEGLKLLSYDSATARHRLFAQGHREHYALGEDRAGHPRHRRVPPHGRPARRLREARRTR